MVDLIEVEISPSTPRCSDAVDSGVVRRRVREESEVKLGLVAVY